MGRQKKNNSLQEEKTNEVSMKDEAIEMVDMTQEVEKLNAELDTARLELEMAKKEIEERKADASSRRTLGKDEVVYIEKQVMTSVKDKAAKELIEKQKSYDNVMVTGKFINRRAPGNPAKLTYLKYEDDPVKWYTFEDGKVYTIPRGFADQINEHYYRPSFIQKSPNEFMDPSRPSSAISEVDTSNKIYSFVPVNF